MTGKDIFTAMNHIDEELVESAAEIKEKKIVKNRTVFIKWAAVLIISLICIGGTTGIAAWNFSINVKNKFTTNDKSGVELGIKVETVSQEEFKGDIQKMFESGIYSDDSDWKLQFDSADKAIEFLGFEGLKKNELSWKEKDATVVTVGNQEGRLCSLFLDVRYEVNGFDIIESSSIRTQKSNADEISQYIYSDKETVFQEEDYVTESGKHALIITIENAKEKRYGKKALVFEGRVLYQCNVFYGNREEKKAESIIKEWLEQF